MTDLPLINSLIFAGTGVIVFLVAFSLAIKLAPGDFWKQIVVERNVAAAIVGGAVALALGWIVASAVH